MDAELGSALFRRNSGRRWAARHSGVGRLDTFTHSAQQENFIASTPATGKTIWAKNILTENGAPNLQWGVAGSPLIVDGMVVVQPGGAGGKSVVAYDKLTGKTVWTSLDDPQSYSSPTLATLDGERQIVSVSRHARSRL